MNSIATNLLPLPVAFGRKVLEMQLEIAASLDVFMNDAPYETEKRKQSRNRQTDVGILITRPHVWQYKVFSPPAVMYNGGGIACDLPGRDHESIQLILTGALRDI